MAQFGLPIPPGAPGSGDTQCPVAILCCRQRCHTFQKRDVSLIRAHSRSSSCCIQSASSFGVAARPDSPSLAAAYASWSSSWMTRHSRHEFSCTLSSLTLKIPLHHTVRDLLDYSRVKELLRTDLSRVNPPCSKHFRRVCFRKTLPGCDRIVTARPRSWKQKMIRQGGSSESQGIVPVG